MEISRSNLANQRAVVEFGGISQLANLMKASAHVEVKVEVAGALWSLSEDPDIKVEIARAGTIAPLVGLLGTGQDSRSQEHAGGALKSIGLNNEENQVQITQLLIELLPMAPRTRRSAPPPPVDAGGQPDPHEAITKAGNPASLVLLLQNGIANAKDYRCGR